MDQMTLMVVFLFVCLLSDSLQATAGNRLIRHTESMTLHVLSRWNAPSCLQKPRKVYSYRGRNRADRSSPLP